MVAPIPVDVARAEDGLVRIFLEGRVDLTTVPKLRDRLLGCAKKRETQEMAVDMAGVTQLDTAGVAMLVELRRALGRRGGRLRLSGLSETARRLLHLAGIEEILAIKDDTQ